MRSLEEALNSSGSISEEKVEKDLMKICERMCKSIVNCFRVEDRYIKPTEATQEIIDKVYSELDFGYSSICSCLNNAGRECPFDFEQLKSVLQESIK